MVKGVGTEGGDDRLTISRAVFGFVLFSARVSSSHRVPLPMRSPLPMGSLFRTRIPGSEPVWLVHRTIPCLLPGRGGAAGVWVSKLDQGAGGRSDSFFHRLGQTHQHVNLPLCLSFKTTAATTNSLISTPSLSFWSHLSLPFAPNLIERIVFCPIWWPLLTCSS